MFLRLKGKSLHVVGVALQGREGSPTVVLEAPEREAFLPLSVDPFDAEIIIRAFLDEELENNSFETSLAWLAEMLIAAPPRRGLIERRDDNRFQVRFLSGFLNQDRGRVLSLGEGLVLCRKLGIPLDASEALFNNSREELSWLSNTGAFMGDFLYLSPTQYAPGIPVE